MYKGFLRTRKSYSDYMIITIVHRNTMHKLVAICTTSYKCQTCIGNKQVIYFSACIAWYLVIMIFIIKYNGTPFNRHPSTGDTHDIMDNSESPDCPSTHFNT